jgi:WD40 repeat protein
MCRFMDAGRSVLKHPILWLALIVWAVCTILVYWLIPASPSHHVEIDNEFEFPVALFGDKSTIVTTLRETDGRKSRVRFRDARHGQLMGEIEKSGMNLFDHNAISRNDRWIGFVNRNENIPWIEIHDASSHERVHGLPSSEAVFSNKSDCIAHRDETLQILDLHTGKSRVLNEMKASPRCFSGDDRYLACVSDKFIQVLDVATGAPITTLAVTAANDEPYVNAIEFGPDGESLAWRVGGTVVVMDLKATNRCVIENAHLVGCLPSGRVLTAQRPTQFQPKCHVELWEWRENRKIARWDLPKEIELVVGYMKTWAAPPETFIAASPDGRNVLFAGYVHDRAPAPWLAKVHEWLKLPSERGLHLEVFMLDGETLALRDHWQIPARQSRDVILQFTPDGQQVLFTDGHVVEYWPVPSHSWPRSAAWGAAGLLLLTPVLLWRFWRRRKSVR